MIGIYELIGIFGLLSIIIGILKKKRKHEDVCYIIGGVALAIYSISLGNLIFIILQFAVTIAAIYDLIKNYKK